MITPDRLAAIRRAARRAVRKYDLVYVAMGRENCSASRSTRGTRLFGLGMPMALKETSMRPALSTTDSRCSSTARSSRASTSAAPAAPPAATMSLATPSTGAAERPVRKTVAPSAAKARATAPPIAPPAPYTTATLSFSIISGSFRWSGCPHPHRHRDGGNMGGHRPPSSPLGRCPYRMKVRRVASNGSEAPVVAADLLTRARAGDGDAFRELTEPYR